MATLSLALALILSPNASSAAETKPKVWPDSRMSFLDNGVVRLGIDLNRGGAIVYLAPKGGKNIVNNFDLGRQVQLSFFSGPVPFSVDGKRPKKHWEHIGWNPIQAGDDFRNRSKVLEHKNTKSAIYVKSRPMQWPLDNVPGDCTFETWLELEGSVVKARARLTNARTDRKQYPARQQELPAVYANAAFHRVVSYTGRRPYTNDQAASVPKPTGKHPWSFWLGTEGWTALLDQQDQGLGLITPGRIHFTGGFAGKPGSNDTFGNSTSYVAGLGREILDHDVTYDFKYELVVGSLVTIRKRAASHRRTSLPAWTFAKDRQGWHYQNASDNGWPIKGHLDTRLDQDDPQMWSPYFFVHAADAPTLFIEAAFKSRHRHASVYWQRFGQAIPAATNTISFPIKPDGKFHRYSIKLKDAGAYRGIITRLRIDPSPAGSEGDWAKIRSIRFEDQP